ncbi:MAG: Hsp20/alpha crystallin family protein [Halobacteriales archaeon]
MRRDDRRDPFGDFFEEFERMIEDLFGEGTVHVESMGSFGTDTHVDIYEEDDEVRVVADLPGVAKEDIEVKSDGRTVSIRAEGERRSYDEQVRLPRGVDENTARASYNNGVLEITFETSGSGQSIDID